MSDDNARCACGWERPLIGLTCLDGTEPTHNIVPFYRCPRCGTLYVSKEIPEEDARRLAQGFPR